MTQGPVPARAPHSGDGDGARGPDGHFGSDGRPGSRSPADLPATPVIEVDRLVKRYRKANRNAVDGISFQVGAGELFALLGPNGAGKTTTLSILTTVLSPSNGSARIAGLDVVRQASRVRREVGIIFQRPSLDQHLTGEENVRFHAILYGLYPFAPGWRLMSRDYRARVEELAAVVGLGREIFDPVKRYSGGMRRKLEIVRSLMHRPRVLFLDEPTSGLDAPTRRSLWAYLGEQRRSTGTTVFLTTHYLEEAEQADRVCVIDDGRIVAAGTPAQLKAQLTAEWLVVDAADANRPGLTDELAGLGLSTEAEPGGGYRLAVSAARAHEVLRTIRTPLTLVRTHAPTLEDAYLEIVGRRAESEGEAEGGDDGTGRDDSAVGSGPGSPARA